MFRYNNLNQSFPNSHFEQLMPSQFQSLQLQNSSLRQQNKTLRDQIKALRQQHQYTIMELTDAKDNQIKLKQINDTLIKSLEENAKQYNHIQDINLVLEGQFTSQKISQLQKQLQKYRDGVNASVDRRVRQIIQGFNQMQGIQRQKSKSISSDNNVSINYNIHQQKGSSSQKCQTCAYLKGLLSDRDKIINEISMQLDEQRADNSILIAKNNKIQALVQTLKQQNNIINNQLQQLHYQLQLQKQNNTYPSQPTYQQLRQLSRLSSRKKVSNQSQTKVHMIRQINNLVNGFSSRKISQDRSKSRIVNNKDSNCLFSIKNGINRPGQLYY